MPEWLQYGALGLLAMVLAGGGVLIKWLLSRIFDEILTALAGIQGAIERGTTESARQWSAWGERYDEARTDDRHALKNAITVAQGAVVVRIDEAHDGCRELRRDMRDELRAGRRSPAE